MNLTKNLNVEAPRSPAHRLGDYAVMARMIDKGRADLQGLAGEYHYDCPLDQMLFEFKGVKAEDVKNLLATGATDEQVVAWFNEHGIPKTAEEIRAWSDQLEARSPYNNPERREWFVGECTRLGLNPEVSTIVHYLETDDLASFKK